MNIYEVWLTFKDGFNEYAQDEISAIVWWRSKPFPPSHSRGQNLFLSTRWISLQCPWHSTVLQNHDIFTKAEGFNDRYGDVVQLLLGVNLPVSQLWHHFSTNILDSQDVLQGELPPPGRRSLGGVLVCAELTVASVIVALCIVLYPLGHHWRHLQANEIVDGSAEPHRFPGEVFVPHQPVMVSRPRWSVKDIVQSFFHPVTEHGYGILLGTRWCRQQTQLLKTLLVGLGTVSWLRRVVRLPRTRRSPRITNEMNDFEVNVVNFDQRPHHLDVCPYRLCGNVTRQRTPAFELAGRSFLATIRPSTEWSQRFALPLPDAPPWKWFNEHPRELTSV